MVVVVMGTEEKVVLPYLSEVYHGVAEELRPALGVPILSFLVDEMKDDLAFHTAGERWLRKGEKGTPFQNLIEVAVLLAKEGSLFEGDLGMMLGKIGINPIVTGLRLCGTLESGVLFTPETLDIDFEQFESDLIGYAAGAFNLACNITWVTSQTMPTLLAKASREALAVALEAAITTADTLPHLIARAHASALGVAGTLDAEALDDELSAMLGAAASAAASAASTVVEEEESSDSPAEEEEEEEEEAAFGGLGDLFG